MEERDLKAGLDKVASRIVQSVEFTKVEGEERPRSKTVGSNFRI